MTEKELFILKELQAHGKFVQNEFNRSLWGKKVRKTGELQQGIAFAVDTSKPALTASFENYGRFIEIAFHKKGNGRLSSEEARRLAWRSGPGARAPKKKKNTTWYAHNLYGSLNRLIGHLGWGYSEEVMALMKEELERGGFRDV